MYVGLVYISETCLSWTLDKSKSYIKKPRTTFWPNYIICNYIFLHLTSLVRLLWNQPPRYNWNIVESGIKHHNPIVKPLILQFENMLYVFFLTHFNGYALIGINRCCVCVWWPSLNSFMTNLHRFSVKTSDLSLKFVHKIIAMIQISLCDWIHHCLCNFFYMFINV